MKKRVFVVQPIPEVALDILRDVADVTVYPHLDRQISTDELVANAKRSDLLFLARSARNRAQAGICRGVKSRLFTSSGGLIHSRRTSALSSEEASHAAEPMVRRLFAGGDWIRTSSMRARPAQRVERTRTNMSVGHCHEADERSAF